MDVVPIRRAPEQCMLDCKRGYPWAVALGWEGDSNLLNSGTLMLFVGMVVLQ